MDDPAFISDRINSFSLVSYVPGELGQFLTELRQQLVQGCIAQSHVTVLPPRPLWVPTADAEDTLRRRIEPFPPFRLEIAELSVFEQTSVVFADIGAGRDELLELHTALNDGPLHFDEPYPYHPHITLAQGFPPEQLRELYARAQNHWRESTLDRSFQVDSLTFVQNTLSNRWLDLAECQLRGAVAVPAR
jgi:2'-5' RNA ligase